MGIEETAVGLLAELRECQPVVHHLANFVTMSDVAAVTRALGAMPIMAMGPEEVQEVASSADAMVVSLGTPTTERLDAIARALPVARRRGSRQDVKHRLEARCALGQNRTNVRKVLACARRTKS